MRVIQANTQSMNQILGKTKEKLINQELRLLEERFKGVFDNANDCMVYLDLAGTILDVNRKGLELVGGVKKDFIGKHFAEFWTTDSKDKSHAMNMLRKMLSGEKLNFKTDSKNKKGQNIELEVSASLVKDDGKAFGILVIARDITEFKKAEEKVGYETEKYKTFFENARDVVVTFDLKGKLTSVNKAIREYDLREDEVVGKNLLKFVSKSYWPMVLKDIARAALGEQIDGEIELITPKGKRIVEYRSNPLKKGEKVISVLSVLRDITERKKIDDELRASEEKYRSLFEEAMDATFVADAKTGIIIDCNRAASELVGREKSELIGKHQRILHPPEDTVGKFSKTFTQHLKEKEGQILETKVITKDGRLKDVSIKAKIFKLGDKKVIQGIFRDITERKRIEEELTHERDFLQALMNNIPDFIYFKDRESRFLRVNKSHTQALGIHDVNEAIGKIDFDFFPEEHAREYFEDEQNIMKTEQPLINKIEKVRMPDGRIRWASTTKIPIKNNYGNVIGLVGISRDITERKQIEEKLEYERDLLQVLMDNIPDTIYFKDAASRFMRINKAQARALGAKDPQDAIGKADFDFFTDEHSRDAYIDEQRIVKTGQPLINNVEKITTPDGRFWWASATKVPIKNKEGQIIGTVGISRDITKLVETEKELRRYSTQLEEIVEERTRKLREAQRLAAIGETAAMVGHDLRNPLQTVAVIPYMVGQMVQSMPVSAKEIVEKNGLPELMNMLRDQTVYMNKIVSDLQDYSRPVNLELEEINLYDMINETLSPTQIPENIEVHNEIEHGFLATLDSYLMKRVFTNLILNAVQAMPEGGKLTIKASRNNEDVPISVQDTGVGIPEENMPKLFQPYSQRNQRGKVLGWPYVNELSKPTEADSAS